MKTSSIYGKSVCMALDGKVRIRHPSVQVIITTNNATFSHDHCNRYLSHHFDVLSSSIHQKYYAWGSILQYAFHLKSRYSLLVDSSIKAGLRDSLIYLELP